MSSALAEVVAPAYRWVPPRARSRGADAVELAALAGLHLDPWQCEAIDVILGEDERGLPSAFEAAVLVSRQNGKGSILEALELYWLLVERVPLVLHSAHEFKTAAEGFRRIVGLLRSSDELWPEVDRVLTGAGSEAVEFVDGQRLRFVARSKGSGRGFTADKVILDEAYALSADEMAAMLPTLATREAAQVVYTSSAPMATSAVLHSVVRRGRRGGDPSLAYVEWRAPGSLREPGCADVRCRHEPDTPGCALDREDFWLAANPGRVPMDFIRKERRALDPAGFSRERLGWESDPAGESRLTAEAWLALADEQSRPEPLPVGIAVDTTKGLRRAVVAACGVRTDGRRHVEVLREDAGTEWLPEFLAPLCRSTRARVRILGGSSTAQAVVPALERARVPVEETSVSDYAAACGLLVDDVAEGRLVHRGQPSLSRAVEAVATVPVGDGGAFRWSPERSGGDVAALVAVTLARWQLEVDPQAVYDVAASVG